MSGSWKCALLFSVYPAVDKLFVSHPSTPYFQAAAGAAAAAAAAFGGEVVLPDGPAAGAGSDIVEEEEEEEEEWTGDPNNRPIWKLPVVSRVRYSSCYNALFPHENR